MIDGLRHFLLIADHGTFTEAARRAHLSQPALSASIKRLEDELAARLLDRGPGGAALTASGQALRAREPSGQVFVDLGAIAAVKGNVRAGIGLALVSRVAVKTDPAPGWMVEIPRRWTPLTRRLILRPRGVDRLPPAAAAFRTMLLKA